MATVLVTGGAGFVGSFVVDELVALGHTVRVLDSLSPAAHDGPPAYLNPGADHAWCDLADLAERPELVAGVDAVCHQAARVGIERDPCDLPAYVRDNDLGTATLLRALYATGFRGRLVLASSMVVYGEGRYRCAEHGVVRPTPRERSNMAAGRFEPPCSTCGRALMPEPVTEDAPLDPRSVYAATKLHQEHLCTAFARLTDVPLTTLRYHNVYGPRMPRDTPYAGVASIFRSACAAGRAPEVFEDGGQLRDFVHVRDVAHANVLALTAGDPVGGAFNVASGAPHTVGELAAGLHDATGGTAPAPRTTGACRLGDVRHVFASPAAATRHLGFTATVDFATGLREFAAAALRDPATGGRRRGGP